MVGRYRSAEEREALELEAARRFLKARSTDSEQDWDEALAWAGEDPAHGFAFAKAEASWELTERLREGHPDLRPAMAVPLVETGTAAGWISGRIGRRGVIGLIAATMVGVIATVTIQLQGSVDRYRTALGEEREVRLADGSILHLNTDTSVEVALRDDARRIQLLKGEARFDVAHDTARPFLVTAGSATVRAVGTAFNVRLRSDLTELTVIEGMVAVQDGASRSSRVGAGTGAAIRSGTVAVTPLAPASVKQRMAWQNGLIEFDGDTLAQAVEEFNRYRASPLVIGDPQLASLRIGGTFRAQKSADFVNALEVGFGIRAIEGHDNSIILVPATARE
ncbi:FecR domain-containing protein [Sphingomonas naphthae]|uniref:FecR domain-containing protein n=1 Tax=Sphingomonas naphthae TaxID=1813468 RepID=A0ABY7TN16_9SPHN|nr:FecR domain-containing protein [Sphingomonas naphthae]WCT74413.1 FecR domain-containing protein [Sphingomonas naphthae]